MGGSPFGSRAAPAPRPECVRRAAAPTISSEQRVPEQSSEKLQHAACRAAKSARSTTCASASSTWSCTPVYGRQEAGAARSTAESAQRPVWLPSRSRSRCGDAGEDREARAEYIEREHRAKVPVPYLLQPIIIPTWASALALARWGGSLAEPYQFRNAWPGRFERGNVHH